MTWICERLDCGQSGEWYPVILVPAKGASMRSALRMIVPLRLCRDHHAEIDPNDFLLPEGRNKIRVALMQRGWAMPDFKRATLARGRVGDEDWRAFHEAPD